MSKLQYHNSLPPLSLNDPRWLFWLAALIDGEGCIQCSRQNKSIYRHASVLINMTDRDTIYRARAIAGHGDIQHRVSKIPGHKPQWRWRVSGKPAVDLLQKTMPLLSRRRAAKAREVLILHNKFRKRGLQIRRKWMRGYNASVKKAKRIIGQCPNCEHSVALHPLTSRTLQHWRLSGDKLFRCLGGISTDSIRPGWTRLTCSRGHTRNGSRCRSCERIRAGWKGQEYHRLSTRRIRCFYCSREFTVRDHGSRGGNGTRAFCSRKHFQLQASLDLATGSPIRKAMEIRKRRPDVKEAP
jgi:hypothetical protein